jgi:hypothetical protein
VKATFTAISAVKVAFTHVHPAEPVKSGAIPDSTRAWTPNARLFSEKGN